MKDTSQLSIIMHQENQAQSITNILEIKGQVPNYILALQFWWIMDRGNLTMVKPTESIVQ